MKQICFSLARLVFELENKKEKFLLNPLLNKAINMKRAAHSYYVELNVSPERRSTFKCYFWGYFYPQVLLAAEKSIAESSHSPLKQEMKDICGQKLIRLICFQRVALQ